MSESAKYTPLQDHLRSRPDEAIDVDLATMADLAGGLPESAHRRRAWWANDATHAQARAWLHAGRRVDEVDLHSGRVRFSAISSPQAPPADSVDAAAADPAMAPTPPGVPWADVWQATAETMAAHLQAGREHLLTEDVLRFALARTLQDRGVEPGRLRAEHRVEGIGAIDLVIDTPPTAAVEIKYPRDPEGSGAGDTMIHGELLADFYRLAGLAPVQGWAVQLLHERLRGYLTRRHEIAWTWSPGETVTLTCHAVASLPSTARDLLPSWATELDVQVTCHTAHQLNSLVLVAYRVGRL